MEQSIMTKPTIVIYCAPNVTESMFSNFLFGIEEEGLQRYARGTTSLRH